MKCAECHKNGNYYKSYLLYTLKQVGHIFVHNNFATRIPQVSCLT